MNTTEEWSALCEQQRKLIEILLAEQRMRTSIIYPSTSPQSPSIQPQGPWYNPVITCGSGTTAAGLVKEKP